MRYVPWAEKLLCQGGSRSVEQTTPHRNFTETPECRSAFVGGLLIGDRAGRAIAVGGLAVGITGLYLWLN